MVKAIPHIDHDNKFYEGYVLGKQSRHYFLKEVSYRAKKVLELIYTDICGPITPNSLSKHRYFITFIDDFSRRTWIYFLKEKLKHFVFLRSLQCLLKT
jgi:hypothetical protein